jgi:hypothetical protein
MSLYKSSFAIFKLARINEILKQTSKERILCVQIESKIKQIKTFIESAAAKKKCAHTKEGQMASQARWF